MSPRRRTDLRRALAGIARSQSGYFTAAQALAVGYSYPAQKYHADRGNWERVERGIYRLPEWPAARHDDLVRWTLWSRGRAVVSHDSALSFYELGDVSPARVHLTVPAGFRARAEAVVLHHADLSPDDLASGEGFRVTTPLRALAETAAGSLELDHLARAVADALARGLVTPRQLRAKAEELGAHAALRIERALLQEAA